MSEKWLLVCIVIDRVKPRARPFVRAPAPVRVCRQRLVGWPLAKALRRVRAGGSRPARETKDDGARLC